MTPLTLPARASSYAELSLLLVAALLTYTLTDSLELSGILSLFFSGITMRHYTYYNLSPAAQVGTAGPITPRPAPAARRISSKLSSARRRPRAFSLP